MFKSVENEKSLENKAFLRILYFDKKIVKVAEMLENKGFHRTQSKNATELITDYQIDDSCYFSDPRHYN